MDAWFEPIMSFTDSPWAYLIAFLTTTIDAFLPILPSESALITCGVFATVTGFTPNLFLLILTGALGAFIGDNITYSIGRWAEPFAKKHMLSGKRGRKAQERAERWLREHGGIMIVVGRYVPGGRTAVALVAGMLHYPRRRFMFFAAIAASTWSTYAVMLGFWGGSAFKDDPLKGVIAGLLVASAITVLVEVGRRLWGWYRKRSKSGDDGGRDGHRESREDAGDRR